MRWVNRLLWDARRILMNIAVNSDSAANFLAILPDILLAVLASLVILLDVFSARSRRGTIGMIAAFGLFVIAVITVLIPVPVQTKQLVLRGLLRHDVLTQFFVTLTLVGAPISCLFSIDAPRVGGPGGFFGGLFKTPFRAR